MRSTVSKERCRAQDDDPKLGYFTACSCQDEGVSDSGKLQLESNRLSSLTQQMLVTRFKEWTMVLVWEQGKRVEKGKIVRQRCGLTSKETQLQKGWDSPIEVWWKLMTLLASSICLETWCFLKSNDWLWKKFHTSKLISSLGYRNRNTGNLWKEWSLISRTSEYFHFPWNSSFVFTIIT